MPQHLLTVGVGEAPALTMGQARMFPLWMYGRISNGVLSSQVWQEAGKAVVEKMREQSCGGAKVRPCREGREGWHHHQCVRGIDPGSAQ